MSPPEEEAVEEDTTPAPEPALMEEILEQIFLRLPPDDPACLVRASLASKLWLGILSGARFHRSYSEHHGAPPMLGFLISTPWDFLKPEEGDPGPPFVPSAGFRPRIPDGGWGRRGYAVWDCRHGRVLLAEKMTAPIKLVVWDPMTGRRTELQQPPDYPIVDFRDGLLGAAVVCAVSGCDHRACHEGPFRVVFFSLCSVGHAAFVAQVYVFSTKTGDVHCGEWSEPCSGVLIESEGYIEPRPPVLVKDALHFILGFAGDDRDHDHVEILQYNLSSNCLSVFDVPSAEVDIRRRAILMAMEDGTLGFARMRESTLYQWSRQLGSDGVLAWTRRRLMDLKNIIPKRYTCMSGSVEGSDIIFVYAKPGIYKINLKTLQGEKIWDAECFCALIPYMSFYNQPERATPYDAAH